MVFKNKIKTKEYDDFQDKISEMIYEIIFSKHARNFGYQTKMGSKFLVKSQKLPATDKEKKHKVPRKNNYRRRLRR